MNLAAQQLGRLGGQAKSADKAEAARENGKKGGRPKKKGAMKNNSENLRKVIDDGNRI